MWFTETPWPPIIGIGALAVALLAAWFSTRRTVFLGLIGLLVALCPVIWYVERVIVTPAEEVEAALRDLADAFQRDDVERTVDFISTQSPTLQTAVLFALDRINVDSGLRISDVNVKTMAADSRAVCHFRANGTFEVPMAGYRGHHASRWSFTWQREAGAWRVLKAQRLDVMTGKEIEWWTPE